jgi:hypothetical protein
MYKINVSKHINEIIEQLSKLMKKISLELDDQLNTQLKQYMMDHYGFTHGKQQDVIRAALRAFLDADRGATKIREPDVEEVCEPEQSSKTETGTKPKARTTKKRT